MCGSVFVVFSLETMYDECIERILSVKTDKNIKQSLRQINYGFWTLIKNFKKLFTDYVKKYIIQFGKVWKDKSFERKYLMRRTEIMPGVNLNTIDSEKFKTNFFSVCFVVPLEKENAHLNALVSKVLLRGCRNYPDIASISKRLEFLYASTISPIYVKRAQSLIIGLSVEFLKDAYLPKGEKLLNDAVKLVFELLFEPLVSDGKFKEDYTESEKIDLINTINAKINNKASYAKERCAEVMFGAHPYGLSELGTVEEVKNASARQVYDRYLHIINNAPAEIFFNGECDREYLEGLISSGFPSSKNRLQKFPGREFLDGAPDEITEVTDEMPVAQGKLVMGMRMSGINVCSENAGAFALFNEIFGGSPSSKLFVHVREEMSLCYYCRSMPDMFMSAMFVSAGIETENRDKACDAILAQLDAMKNGEFSEEDISDAKRSLANSYRELDDSAAAKCLWYLSRIIFGSLEEPETVSEKIMNVTAAQITEAANSVSLDSVYFIKGTGLAQEENN